MAASDLERLIQLLGRLPGLGPRSARRAALHLLKKRDSLMQPLATALAEAAVSVKSCANCGNLDSEDPCAICRDPKRDPAVICVVAEVGDLWALERSATFRGRYHVLGGTLSALDGIGPEQLNTRGSAAPSWRSLGTGGGAGHGSDGGGADHGPLHRRPACRPAGDRQPPRPWPAGGRRARLSRRRDADGGAQGAAAPVASIPAAGIFAARANTSLRSRPSARCSN